MALTLFVCAIVFVMFGLGLWSPWAFNIGLSIAFMAFVFYSASNQDHVLKQTAEKVAAMA